MTRLVTCGWESGDAAEYGNFTGTATNAVVTTTPVPRTPGTYCWKVGPSNYGYRTRTLWTPLTDIWVRFAAWLQGLTSEFPFFYVKDSQNVIQGSLTWSTDQYIRAYRGEVYQLIGMSAPLQLAIGMWHLFDVHWQITNVDIGTVEVWVDDQRWMNFTGVDVCYAVATGNGLPNIQAVSLGQSWQVFNAASYEAFDDVAINDTTGTVNNGRVGEGRIVALRPNGIGSHTDQLRGGVDAGANYAQVNEVPPSMAQYVYHSTPGSRDTYALSDVPAGSYTVNAVEVAALTTAVEAGPNQMALTIKNPGQNAVEASPQIVTVGNSYVRSTWDVNPDTGNPWTVSELNNLEAGTTVR